MCYLRLILLTILLAACQVQSPQTVQPTQPIPPSPVRVYTAQPTQTVSPSPARVYIEPATLQVQVGQSARVRVMIRGVQNLMGVELHLGYDPTLLEIADDLPTQESAQIILGNFLAPEFVAVNKVEQGKIDVAFLQIHESVSGSGQLIEFGVTGRAAGVSALTLDSVNLADGNADAIPAQVEHGQISIK